MCVEGILQNSGLLSGLRVYVCVVCVWLESSNRGKDDSHYTFEHTLRYEQLVIEFRAGTVVYASRPYLFHS